VACVAGCLFAYVAKRLVAIIRASDSGETVIGLNSVVLLSLLHRFCHVDAVLHLRFMLLAATSSYP